MSKSNAQVQTGPHEWKPEDIKCTVGAPVKPRRPYTPYNLFYLLERERVVQKNEPAMALEKKVKSEQIRKTRPFEIQNREEEKIPMPKRYDNVIMLPQWYDPNLKEKRKHRKSAGKVSFKELTGQISKSWGDIDSETKEFCTQISEMGRARYKDQVAHYNETSKLFQLKKEQAAIAAVTKRKKLTFSKANDNSTPQPTRATRRSTGSVAAVTPDRAMSSMSSHHIQAPVVSSYASQGNYHHQYLRPHHKPVHQPPSCRYPEPYMGHVPYSPYGRPPPLPQGHAGQLHCHNGHMPPPMPGAMYPPHAQYESNPRQFRQFSQAKSRASSIIKNDKRPPKKRKVSHLSNVSKSPSAVAVRAAAAAAHGTRSPKGEDSLHCAGAPSPYADMSSFMPKTPVHQSTICNDSLLTCVPNIKLGCDHHSLSSEDDRNRSPTGMTNGLMGVIKTPVAHISSPSSTNGDHMFDFIRGDALQSFDLEELGMSPFRMSPGMTGGYGSPRSPLNQPSPGTGYASLAPRFSPGLTPRLSPGLAMEL